MNRSTIARSFAIAFALILTGCSSTTIINSRPPGAKLYMDGSYKGQTPYSYSDTKIVGSSTVVKLKLDGYDDFNGVLTRSERVDVGALIGGLFVWVPFLWVMQYDPDHTYELTASGANSASVGNSALETKLNNLKKMHDDGTLTDDEYDSLRKKAINSTE